MLLSVDFDSIMAHEFARTQRADDGKLHASSAGSPLRHAQLAAAGAPQKPRTFGDQITLQIGTLIHEWLHDAMRRQGVPYMAEICLDPWMPPGWGGTADAVIWSPELKAFVLVDYKTVRAEGLRFRRKDGASDDHILQTSIYWQSLRKMGIPLAKAVAILYIPKGSVRSKEEVIEPLLVDFEPLAMRALNARMAERKKQVDGYVSGLPKPNPRPLHVEEFLTDALAPPQEMDQRVYFDKASGDMVLKLVPPWQSAYCPFEPPLCTCGEQRSTTIGRWRSESADSYEPRKGFEHLSPTVSPN